MSAADPSVNVVRLTARAHERDRYLSALLAPAPARDDLVALAAFAGEVARVPAGVSEPMLGEIRLQWWRDRVEASATAVIASGHPIADAFGRVQRRHALPLPLVHGVIDGHAARLDDAPFPDAQTLLANLDATDGTLFALASRVLGGDAAGAMDAGRAYGLARLLVELPVTLSQGKILLPLDRLFAHGLDVERLRKDEGGERLARLVAEMAAIAGTHAEAAAQHRRTSSAATRAALRPLALVRPYLRLCQRPARSVFEVRDIAPLTRAWRLWRIGRWGAV